MRLNAVLAVAPPPVARRPRTGDKRDIERLFSRAPRQARWRAGRVRRGCESMQADGRVMLSLQGVFSSCDSDTHPPPSDFYPPTPYSY
ncbi:hypothetical protein EVAR_17700_1 [Eumeta japonica]|uniref:Uncharacterized protein n=1 Tax=Eumeta variegata TaxID=151549 RepID=A0A4C1UT42_EUMVA|nr:hypothetical protein EVAR_17700_1 [Eumeta japonica]